MSVICVHCQLVPQFFLLEKMICLISYLKCSPFFLHLCLSSLVLFRLQLLVMPVLLGWLGVSLQQYVQGSQEFLV